MADLLDYLSTSGSRLLDMVNTIRGGADARYDKAEPGAFQRMLNGMDRPVWSPSFEDVPELAGAQKPQQATKATRDKYVAQRVMRGMSGLVFGVPDLLNKAINAGIRDIDYFTGGGLSGGSYDPFQAGMPSQSAANLATELSGADIVPPDAVPPSTRRVGEYVQAGVEILPIGAGALASAGKGGMAAGFLAGPAARQKLMKSTIRGDSISELPMDEASRMARAKEMGFLTEMPLYHGSADTFTAFDPLKAGRTTGAAPAREATAWVSLDPEIANDFAHLAGKGRPDSSPQVYPLYHRASRPATVDLDGDETALEVAGTLKDLFEGGRDAVMFKNFGGEGKKIIAIRNPEQLRSRFAKFDPAKRSSSDLLADLFGATATGLLGQQFMTKDPRNER